MKKVLTWLVCIAIVLSVGLQFFGQGTPLNEHPTEHESLIAVVPKTFVLLTTETPNLIINTQIDEAFHNSLMGWYKNYLPWLTDFLGLNQHQPRSLVKPQATVYPHFAAYSFATKTDARGIVTVEKNDHDQLTENHLATYTHSPADHDFQRYDVSILRHETVHLLLNHHAGATISNRTLDEGIASTCQHWNPQQDLAWNVKHPPLEQLNRARVHLREKKQNLNDFLLLSAQGWRTSTPEQTDLNYALAEMFVRWILKQEDGLHHLQSLIQAMVDGRGFDAQLSRHIDERSSAAFHTWIMQLP